MPRSFYDWIVEFRSEQTQRGELARDILRDKCFPTHHLSYNGLAAHIRHHEATRDALEILHTTYLQYAQDVLEYDCTGLYQYYV